MALSVDCLIRGDADRADADEGGQALSPFLDDLGRPGHWAEGLGMLVQIAVSREGISTPSVADLV